MPRATTCAPVYSMRREFSPRTRGSGTLAPHPAPSPPGRGLERLELRAPRPARRRHIEDAGIPALREQRIHLTPVHAHIREQPPIAIGTRLAVLQPHVAPLDE